MTTGKSRSRGIELRNFQAERGRTGPRHVAIIMDGNGRWAERRGQPRTVGHHRGVDRVREIIRAAPDLGVETLTLFAFSTENWKRPDYEVSVLMRLFKRYIVREIEDLDQERVRVQFIGEREGLPTGLQRVMAQMEKRTKKNDRLVLQIALNYGSRREMLRAVRHLASEAVAGRLAPEAIGEEDFSAALYTGGMPDPDLVIRTSGEQRVSNFLLWQAAYSEFAFVEECWPDFTPALFERTLNEYGNRERRFGAVAVST
ncbi:MAG TPA: isoprenyl transferase [Thermohalobaculum sp.]|nr:isoprenyl transferase [Thermohalobaculum sp.]